MKYYIRILGGHGKLIAGSGAIVRFAKERKDDEVNVWCDHPEVIQGLPGIANIYDTKYPHFFRDVIKPNQGCLYPMEVYLDKNFYLSNLHVSKVFNIILNGVYEYVNPVINLITKEKYFSEGFIANERKRHGKKIIFMQPWAIKGGRTANGHLIEDDEYRSMSYEFAKELSMNLYLEGYQVYIIKDSKQVGTGDHNEIELNQSVREKIAMLPYIDGVISCDSYLHHAAAALATCPVVTLHTITKPENFSHPGHIAIVSKKVLASQQFGFPEESDYEYYKKINKGCNDFSKETIDQILSIFKGESYGSSNSFKQTNSFSCI